METLKRLFAYIFPIVFILVAFSISLPGQNLRQISHQEGLTNSAVMDLYLDKDNLLWVGTCDGLSVYVGRQVYPTRFSDGSNLNGLIVEQIVGSEEDCLWARTAYGLVQWTKGNADARWYTEFQGAYRIVSGTDESLMVRSQDGRFFRWNADQGVFSVLRLPLYPVADPIGFGATGQYFWLVGKEGFFRLPWIKDEGGVRPGSLECLFPEPVVDCVFDGESVYVTSPDGELFHVDVNTGRRSFLMDISNEQRSRGRLTGVVEMSGYFFLSFELKGGMKYHRIHGRWEGEDLGLNVGVFHLRKDRRQDVLWIATDGQGIYQYWNSQYIVRQFLSEDIHPQIGQPIRAFHKDRSGNLWVGTKGSGLLKVSPSGDKHLYTSSNSLLRDNSVFAFAQSGQGGFWIGSEGGLNFYDEGQNRILSVDGAEDIRYIHSIRESGDTLLQMATVGTGFMEASVRRIGRSVRLHNIRQYTVDHGKFSSNYFFSLYGGKDGTLWLGNRGLGLFSWENGTLKQHRMAVASVSQAVSDVFSMAEAGGNLWIGTGNGLVELSPGGTENYITKQEGLPNNTVHTLLTDQEDCVWIATNEGLARLDPSDNSIIRYGHDRGLSVIEYSDGAAFKTGDTLYFGAVNGWVEVSRNDHYVPSEPFVPSIHFAKFYSSNHEEILYVLLHRSGNKIKLAPGDNTFSIEFYANDNIHPGDYEYFYRIDKRGEGKWLPLEQENRVSFSGMAPGDYQIFIRARNRATGVESLPEGFSLSVAAPWYATSLMKTLYALLSLLIVGAFAFIAIRNVRRRDRYALETMERHHKEELYEEKLMFFTNITHEFRAPLTLIYTPCEQILAYEGTDSYVRRYALQIKNNAERLGTLIQEIIDYRRLESKHQTVKPLRLDLSALCHGIAGSFIDLAIQNGIQLEEKIEDGVIWNMDRKCMVRIETNLITNALKYTREGGTVRVSFAKDGEDVVLKVFNTGKGIREEDRTAIFDRYRVLEGVEETRVNSITGRNGLGLAICKSTVDLLGGTITVDSKVGEWAEFTVRLPELTLPEVTESQKDVIETDAQDLPVGSGQYLRHEEYPGRSGLPILLVVDDNADLLRLLEDSLDGFDVRTSLDASGAMDVLKSETPAVIVTDLMMPGTDGFEFTRQIKTNKHTMHIPVVILSARNAVEDRVKGREMGADVILGKPFSLTELKAVIRQLIGKDDRLKEYYNTSASAFDYVDGKLVSTEDKEFLGSVDAFMSKALSSGEVTVESLAQALNLSTRNLYRRFKSLGLLPPNEFIRDRKLLEASKLLRTTGLTIQEIIYECGFNNRAHFYKEFSKRFGCTPKEYRTGHRTKDEGLD